MPQEGTATRNAARKAAARNAMRRVATKRDAARICRKPPTDCCKECRKPPLRTKKAAGRRSVVAGFYKASLCHEDVPQALIVLRGRAAKDKKELWESCQKVFFCSFTAQFIGNSATFSLGPFCPQNHEYFFISIINYFLAI